MYDLSIVAERVKGLRIKKGYTQERVSEELGIHIRTYRGIEKGERVGQVDTLCLIAEYYGVSLDYLLLKGNDIREEYLLKLKQLPPEAQNLGLLLTESMLNVLIGTTCDHK